MTLINRQTGENCVDAVFRLSLRSQITLHPACVRACTLCVSCNFLLDLLLWASSWAKKLGMEPFEPADVSGWDLDVVWTLDRLQQAHKFFNGPVRSRALEETSQSDFSTIESLQAKIGRYCMGPNQPGMYGYHTRLCGDQLFVNEVGKEGQHMIDSRVMFDGVTYTSARARREAWKEAQSLAVVNVCQFVC